MGPVKKDQTGKPVTPDNIRSMSAHIGLCALYAVAACVLCAFFVRSESTYVLGAAVVTLMLCLGHGVIAFGAARSAPWARIASMVVGGWMLFGFPIGTVIGVYLLVNLKWPPQTTQ